MGVRPPQGGSDDEAAVEFGIAALTEHVDGADISYPATAADVRAALGDREVAYDPSGDTVQVSRVLDRVDRERFESQDDLLEALHPAFEAVREERSGVMGWLRGVVPW